MGYRTPKKKIDQIRTCYMEGFTNMHAIHRQLDVHRNTVRKYFKEFKQIEKLFPHKLKDFAFFLPKPKEIREETALHKELIAALPAIIEQQTTVRLSLIPLWETYRMYYPHGYCLNWFSQHFIAWRREKKICIFTHHRVKIITPEQLNILTVWRNSDNLYWKRAVVILGSYNRKRVVDLAEQVERTQKTVLRWIDNFKEKGIDGLIDEPRKMSLKRQQAYDEKGANLMKILHESPQLHGFNRTSWRHEDLATAYRRIYGLPMGTSTAGIILGKMGYSYRKSREVLTSPDPQFREKLQVIKDILGNLGAKEKFFSIDEMGPLYIRMRGGRTLVKDGLIRQFHRNRKTKVM